MQTDVILIAATTVILIRHLFFTGLFLFVHYQNGGILLAFLSSNKTLPLVIAHGNPH